LLASLCQKYGNMARWQPSDAYTLWLSLLAYNNTNRFQNGRIEFSGTNVKPAFETVSKIFGSRRNIDWESSPAGLGSPDTLLVHPRTRTNMTAYALPGNEEPVYYGGTSWYVGISSGLTGARKSAIVQLLAAALSPEVQLMAAQGGYSPTVRPSIAESTSFQKAVSPHVLTLCKMIPRLRFWDAEPTVSEVEVLLEEAFLGALSQPEQFEQILTEAIRSANQHLPRLKRSAK
jgi:ABC-type glycerol-3-phosphate transport system substrate-binding protein